MDDLEKYFREYRDQFDEAEPANGHFERFEEKYNARFGERSLRFDRPFLLKIAAGILIFLTVSVFLFDFSFHRLRRSQESENPGTLIPAEIQQAEQYFDNTASRRLGDISKLACCGQDTKSISSDASEAINSLDKNEEELKKAMSENPNNERIQAALIQNQQMKEKIVENVIRQVGNVKR